VFNPFAPFRLGRPLWQKIDAFTAAGFALAALLPIRGRRSRHLPEALPEELLPEFAADRPLIGAGDGDTRGGDAPALAVQTGSGAIELAPLPPEDLLPELGANQPRDDSRPLWEQVMEVFGGEEIPPPPPPTSLPNEHLEELPGEDLLPELGSGLPPDNRPLLEQMRELSLSVFEEEETPAPPSKRRPSRRAWSPP
jgi:hypothetical protein